MNKPQSPWSSLFFKSTQQPAEPHQVLRISGLVGTATARWIIERQHSLQKPLLVLTKDFNTASILIKEINFLSVKKNSCLFLELETLPYESQSPEAKTVAHRLQTLKALLAGKVQIVVASVQAALTVLPPPHWLNSLPYVLNAGQTYSRPELIQTWLSLGYTRAEQVEEPGEFAVRGEVVDVFPAHGESSVRLRFQDDELCSLRSLDMVSQQSKNHLNSIELWPTHELELSPAAFKRANQKLADTSGFNLKKVHQLKESFDQQLTFAGIERFLPWFFEDTANLIGYFPAATELIFVDQQSIKAQAQNYLGEVLLEFEDLDQPAPAIKDLLLDLNTLENTCASRVDLCVDDDETIWRLPVHNNQYLFTEEKQNAQSSKSIAVLRQLLAWHNRGAAVFLVVQRVHMAERLEAMLAELNTEKRVEVVIYPQPAAVLPHVLNFERLNSLPIMVGALEQGFRLVDEQGNTQFILITETEIFGRKTAKKKVSKQLLSNLQSTVSDWKVGDYIVHEDYGIGRYEGLGQIASQSQLASPSQLASKQGKAEPASLNADFVTLSYAKGDKIYLPVTRLEQIQKFSSQEGLQPSLSKLGSTQWKATKARVQCRIEEITEELLTTNAKRQAQPGVPFPANIPLLEEFVLRFPFTETEDQESAAEQVSQDLAQPKPMDRLICGDVGVGKTEIAMRAACQVVLNGYQVVLLAPTTLLSNQHYHSFKQRFKDFPINIAQLSRFCSKLEAKDILIRLNEGKIDIIVGTHRLLSKDVQFKRLGLLIIDEEHRFGVKHKEKMKNFRTAVDILALSATPIPRTLNLSMIGVRDISLISTFPPERRVIRGKLAEFKPELVVQAVNRELSRGGQVYFVHNRIESIYQIAEKLQQWMPKIRLTVVHGRMPLAKLEQVMQHFVDGEYDVLVSTSIIESGLDLPNVNTILVNQAHCFGLAQLYQLRGRVGRSYRQSYAYFLLPQDKLLDPLVNKRLSVLREIKKLNAGFKIASHDMEIRGVGDILGIEQSGHLATVGLDLYLSMIEQAASKLKNGADPQLSQAAVAAVQVQMSFEAGLPGDYISSMNQRLAAYRSVAECETLAEVFEVKADLEDRFGELPLEAVNFLGAMQAKLLAQSVNIREVIQEPQGLKLSFATSFKPEMSDLMAYLNQQNGRLLPPDQLLLATQVKDSKQLLSVLENFQQFFKV